MRQFLFLCLFVVIQHSLAAQEICTFAEPVLPPNSFQADFSTTDGFECGPAFFPNEYFTDFGGLWKEGWAVSSATDLSDFSENNLFTAVTGTGSSASPMTGTGSSALQYAVGQQDAYILIEPRAYRPISVEVTNTFHVFNVLEMGNEFARPMGGNEGIDPDFFLLTIRGHLNGVETGEFVEFFLADYRFLDNELDYIIDSWETVDLAPITIADSLSFTLTSSDVGEFGINQPPYFAIDNFVAELEVSSIEDENAPLAMLVYPNPASNDLHLNTPFSSGQLRIFDTYGQLVLNQNFTQQQFQLSVADLPNGMYIIQTSDGKNTVSERFIKL